MLAPPLFTLQPAEPRQKETWPLDHTPLQVIITQRGAHERGVNSPPPAMIPPLPLSSSSPPVAAQSPDLASLAMPADVPPSPIPPLIP